MRNDRLLRDWLDGSLDQATAEAFLAGLDEVERREALALRRIGTLASRAPSAAPPDDFTSRVMARVRTRRPPRRTLWTWLRSPTLSPLAAIAAASVVALGAFGVAEWRPRTPPAAAVPAGQVLARLSLQAPRAREVSVAGDFNGWKPEKARMRREPNGLWSIEVPLAAGRRYQYMFVVDGQWVTDPAAAATVEDGFGHQNAVLDI